MTSGTKLYFVALLLRNEIASRGGFVMHTGSARYYQLLLSLKDLAVLDYLKDTSASMPDAPLQALLDDVSLHEPLVPLEDSDEPDTEQNGDIESYGETASSDITDALPIVIQRYAAETAQLRPYQYEGSHGVAYVHFDNCSHSSGKLRAFIKCGRHEGCTKHIQVETAGSRHAAICYCVAWLYWAEAERLPRDKHSCKEPPAAWIDHCVSRIPESA